MICPLYQATILANPNNEGYYADCDEAICAWWNDKEKKCAILLIAERLGRQFKVALAR